MKDYIEKKVVIELEPAEEEAFETVLNALERMTYLYEEQDVESLFLKVPQVGEVEISFDMPARAIQALEEIQGVWA